jgi:hypothetical protein
MVNLVSNLFEMYKESMDAMHCKNCNVGLKKDHRLLGPISFWHLGEKFEDKSVSTITFVGKTTWMDPEDYSKLEKKETIYDGRPETIKFFGEGLKRCQYWRTIKEISSAIYFTLKGLNFLSHVFITNLAKCNAFEKEAESNNLTGYNVFSNCIDIFEKEIMITKPSHIVFFTNDYYDKLINNLDFGYGKNNYSDIRNYRKAITKRDLKNKSVCWWHRRFPKNGKAQMHFLRTRHPQGAPREFKKEIIKWIQDTPPRK